MRGGSKPSPGQPPLFEPDSDWRPPSLSDLPSWEGARRVSIDTETRDEQLSELGPGVRRPNCYIVGYSVAIEDGPEFYVPIRHGGGGNVDANQGLNYLRDQSKLYIGDIAGAHLDYDLDFLAEEGITFPHARRFCDVQVADALISELSDTYTLDAICGRWGIPGKDERLLDEALAAWGYVGHHRKKGLWRLHSRFVGLYGERDARAPLQILTRQERELENQSLENVWKLESDVLPILTEMRRIGVRVSMDRLEQVEKWSKVQQQIALDDISFNTGVTLDFTTVTLASEKAKVLKAIGVQVPLTTKTRKPSVTKDLLEGLKHPVATSLRRALKMNQLRTMFCNSVRAHLIKGRIHCTFNQLRRSKTDEEEGGDPETSGAAYGRLSSEHTNMQQQPARDEEIGPMWRSIYLPDEGAEWASHDYSQQEPRMGVHYAVVCGEEIIGRDAYRSAMEAAKRYWDNPKTDFHDMMTMMVHGDDVRERVGKDKFKALRRDCKEIHLGLSYEMGGAKLCRKLGLPTRWAFRPNRTGYGSKSDLVYFDTYGDADTHRYNSGGGKVFEVAGAEGQAILDKFNANVPFIKRTSYAAQDVAKKCGFITTISGRRCRFPKTPDGDWDWTHKAYNRLIQGASADQTKTALVAIRRAGYRLQLQVHDEFDRSSSGKTESDIVAKIMEECLPLKVPSRVETKMGPSWGEAA